MGVPKYFSLPLTWSLALSPSLLETDGGAERLAQDNAQNVTQHIWTPALATAPTLLNWKVFDSTKATYISCIKKNIFSNIWDFELAMHLHMAQLLEVDR